MSSGLFIVDYPAESNLPPHQAESGLQLAYDRPGEPGKYDGGWSTVGLIPQRNSVLVLVDASAATILAMRADVRYLPILRPRPLGQNDNLTAAQRTRTRNWLLARGVPANIVAQLNLATRRSAIRALRSLHGVGEREGVDDENDTDEV